MKIPAYITTKRVALASLIALTGVTAHKVVTLSEDPTTDLGCAEKTDTNPTTTAPYALPQLIFKQFGGTINDASCVGSSEVHAIIKISSESEAKAALAYAIDNNLTVSLAGARHSMGGHTVNPGNLVLDMTGLRDVVVNRDTMSMKVGAGATWHDIQTILHPEFAVAAMQSTDIFTVGGSISVNAHGMDHQIGAVENTIRSLQVLLPDGRVVTASRTQESELYEAVVGGYGLFGIILEAELDIVPNDIYTSRRVVMPFTEFPSYFETTIQNNPNIGLMYTHLSTAPSNLLEEAIVYEYEKSEVMVSPADIPPLAPVSTIKLRRFLMNFSKLGALPQELRWWAEKYLEPKFESCSISRTSALGSGEACFVARNEPMHDSVPYLYNNLTNETDILHEYFIPRANIVAFVDGLRTVVQERDINLLNASVRVVGKERGLLTYAPEDAFSVVLFINQSLSEAGNAKMRADTSALIDLAHAHQGRFFLPYQLYYTSEQLRTSYPTIDDFLARKAEYDPNDILQSRFYQHLKAQ